MSKLLEQFHEDKALRDAARAVLVSDVEHARSSLTPKGFADRIGGRIGDGAKDVYSVAKTHADDNRGIIAALIGAILLWVSRDTILEILGLEVAEGQAEEAEEPQPSSQTDAETEDTVDAEAYTPAPLDDSPDGDNDEQ